MNNIIYSIPISERVYQMLDNSSHAKAKFEFVQSLRGIPNQVTKALTEGKAFIELTSKPALITCRANPTLYTSDKEYSLDVVMCKTSLHAI